MRRSSWPARSPGARLRMAVVGGGLAVLIALTSFALLTYALSRPPGSDVAAYWNAAERLRAGEPLYVPAAANASDLYRYAPWFAVAWIPLSYLPKEAVVVGWVGLMILAALISTVPLLARGPTGWAAFAFFMPLQLEGAIFGNIQPLLVLMLMWGVERRSGPLWIAVGASLKATPLALTLVYAGRGEWQKAGWAVLLTSGLLAPMLLFDLSAYPTMAGPNQTSLAGVSVLLFLPVALASLVVAYTMARTRFGWLAGAVAMVATTPRLLSYQVGYILVGLPFEILWLRLRADRSTGEGGGSGQRPGGG